MLIGGMLAVWALLRERYHARALATPREVKLALAYVLDNFRRHERAALGGAGSGRDADGRDFQRRKYRQ